MSTTYAVQVHCPACNAAQSVLLAESANVQRSPAWRQSVLDGTFHRFACATCGVSFTVERDVLYADLLNGVLIGCHPRARRGELELLETQVAEAWARVIVQEAPAAVSRSFRGPGPRVVFGLAELREKVVCFDAGLDDRLVEAMKLALLEGIPGANRAGVAGLVLVAMDHAVPCLVFQPVGSDRQAIGAHLLQAPLSMYEAFAATRTQVQALLPGLFEGLWVDASRARPAAGTGATA